MRTEWFPLVNEEGETIGKATPKTFHEQGYTTGKVGHGRRWAY